MAFEASTILQLIALLTWTCLITTPEKFRNIVYSKVLLSHAVVEQLFTTASLVFAPGLFEVIEAVTPPTISFFQSLPTSYDKQWAVYLLVLEKDGHRPKIYVGSGTNVGRGVRARFLQYDRYECIPVYVARALKDGFEIVHKGLLVTAPIPSAAMIPSVRTLFLAIVTALSFTFWAMYSKDKLYCLEQHICPWEIAGLDYDGLCSHPAFWELPAGEHDFTAEELEAQEKKRREKKKEREAMEYVKNKSADPEAFNAKMASYLRASQSRNRPVIRAKARKLNAKYYSKAREEKKYHCDTCNHSFANDNHLQEHLHGGAHRDALAGIKHKPTTAGEKRRHDKTLNKARASKKYYCAVCDLPCGKKNDFTKHNKTKAHLKKVEAALEVTQSGS